MNKSITLEEFIKELLRFVDYRKISDGGAEYELWSLTRKFDKNDFSINLKFRRKNEQKDRYIFRV